MHTPTPWIRLLLLIVFTSAVPCSQFAFAVAQPSLTAIPFVGCESDGQVGPAEAPHGTSELVQATSEEGERLSYYEMKGGLGVVAPRGWFCLGAYGSGGNELYVSPKPIRSDLFSSTWAGFAGPAIQITQEYGDTSGRFGVASVIARVFPAHTDYVRRILSEGIQPRSFPSGPYPNDQLTYKGDNVVEYTTAPESEGLGTHSRLAKGQQAISGVAVLAGETPDLILLSMRLPQSLSSLKEVITRQVERDAEAIDPR